MSGLPLTKFPDFQVTTRTLAKENHCHDVRNVLTSVYSNIRLSCAHTRMEALQDVYQSCTGQIRVSEHSKHSVIGKLNFYQPLTAEPAHGVGFSSNSALTHPRCSTLRDALPL